MIKRIFHPIGQGAFYSERHDGFNIVYDCGNWKNTKLSDKVVRQGFLKNETIDILFISHFDYDHVNKIKILRDHTKIKRVVMPLLHDKQKHMLINIYRVLNFNLLALISNPQEFFGDETQVITVELTENNESPINDNIESQDIDSLTTSTIPSGSTLTRSKWGYDWVYIPCNYEYSARNNKLEDLLSNTDFDVDKLKNNPDYTLDTSIKKRKRIKEIYSQLSGNINQNSMLLYSGPLQSPVGIKYSYHINHCCTHIRCRMWPKYRDEKVGCLYTGDANLNVVNVQQIFKHFWGNIGTIQIPHHGDLKSFNQKILDDGYYLCPISVGENNSYGHPSSKVIADVFSRRSHPILITENLSSGFFECIKC